MTDLTVIDGGLDAPKAVAAAGAGKDKGKGKGKGAGKGEGAGKGKGAGKGEGAGKGDDQGPPPYGSDGTIFPDCPVVALGRDKLVHYFLDSMGQVVEATRLDQNFIAATFGGNVEGLQKYFPQFKTIKDEDGTEHAIVSGWKADLARNAMMMACSYHGVWNDVGRVRGAGMWVAKSGELIAHCGNEIFIGPDDDGSQPGRYDKLIYPRMCDTPRPWETPVEANDPDIGAVAERLKTWGWANPEVDSDLVFGWSVAAMVGGALPWRPNLWVTGDRSTGKSTLQALLRFIQGDGGRIDGEDLSAAFIKNRMGSSSLPVLVDEVEAGENEQRLAEIIQLARNAASGARSGRSSANHTVVEFTAQSAMCFTSIKRPSLGDADLQRIVCVNLVEPPTGVKFDPAEADWETASRKLRRRLMDVWPRRLDVIQAFRNALAEAGHGHRGQDVFGACLAWGWLALRDDVPCDDVLRDWTSHLGAEEISEQRGESEDWRRMLDHLSGYMVETAWKAGHKRSVHELVYGAAGLEKGLAESDRLELKAVLGAYGMTVVSQGKNARFYMAGNHSQLAGIFKGTEWHAFNGRQGVWVQSLMRAPGYDARHVKMRIGNAPKNKRAHGVPVSVFLEDVEEEEDQGR